MLMGMKQILVMMVAVVLVGQSVVADEKKLIAAPRRETGPKDLRVLTGEPWLRGIPAGVTVETRASLGNQGGFFDTYQEPCENIIGYWLAPPGFTDF